MDAALHAEQRSVDAGVVVRLARGHRDDVRLIEVDLVGVEARAAEVELVEETASAQCEDERDDDGAAHKVLLVDRSFADAPDYRVRDCIDLANS